MKPNLLILKLRDKSLFYSTFLLALLLALAFLLVYKYEVSSDTGKKKLNKNVLFTISMFPNGFYGEIFIGEKILKLIIEKLPLIFFDF